ncbi:PREDICTED: P2X purinoceptor 4-like [Amphimedon queenslandica]|uniref:Uncharacterized protein n=1 Tax=Amphimedon queenslandica TaxID=400682 RepID=A0A1X7VID9_AMPQE|nr:PREDICTED: P2X purinoceptor 4-like [Amphimedon queenslandica]|eukprot:XP_003384136.1 PREDICTED: P2X purinoceptor 4-like [Amphimedon queenslandica]
MSAASACRWLGSTTVSVLFEYDTPKFVHIRNKKVGLLNRLVQLAIVGYIIGYGIVWENGAQDKEPVQSVVTTKVKGVSVLNATRQFMTDCNEWPILDHVDLIVPAQEPNSFFVTTNLWATCNQKYGVCPELSTIPDAVCLTNDSCPPGIIYRTGNGVTTGECTGFNETCQIRGWCPVEDENDTLTDEGPIIDTKDFTVLVKNSISFPKLDSSYRVRNIPERANNKSYLSGCQFDPDSEMGLFCPIFSLKQIVDMINSSDGYYESLATKGAVVGLEISWDCNLDRSPTHCVPKYSARRLDNPNAQISNGFNFRYPRYYRDQNGDDVRDVWKVYGIKFEIVVTGEGRKFSFTTLVLALGSTIALLAIATTVTDVIALYLLKKGTYYREKKYQKVAKEDEESVTLKALNHSQEKSPLLREKRKE